jgi:dTDP-4-amino-4,6-dideoxygalactose transaminase
VTLSAVATQPIPLVDLRWQHAQVAGAVEAGFARVLATTAFINGSDVADFERDFAALCGAAHCVGVANGTDALELALRALDIGPGDEVLLPANTFVATAEAAARAGATPVLCDIDPATYLLDVADAAARVTPRTRAVMPVHLFGQVAPMEQVAELGLTVVEDAAQSQGASRGGKAAGSFGDAAGTSFYPGKNLGAYGDAGAVVTGSDQVAGRVRALRNHGGQSHYAHELLGVNSRLDTLQAVVLNAKLAQLAAWNELRREAAARYDTLLADLPAVTPPVTLAGNVHVWHLYVVRVPERDRVLAHLRASGVGAGIHYPRAVHQQPAFAHLGDEGWFPHAERAAAEILTLPLYPGITAAQQERVVATLREAL